MPYRLDEASGRIDYTRLHENAQLFRPKLVVAGASAYRSMTRVSFFGAGAVSLSLSPICVTSRPFPCVAVASLTMRL